jgi:hypothetical protein
MYCTVSTTETKIPTEFIFLKFRTMERLALISQLDPAWYETIENFLIHNPEFGPYTYLVPIQRPIHNTRLKHKYFIDHLIFYICEAGVNRNYSQKQWGIIKPFLQENDYNIGFMVDQLEGQLQPKKREIYRDLWAKIKAININPLEFSLEHLLSTKIKGVGAGCLGQLKQFWSTNNNAVEITDRGFVEGFAKVYQLDKKPTPSQIQKKIEGWGCEKIVGSLICTQIYHYLLYPKI